MENWSLYRDIAGRCEGDIYVGVVGPVRSGKSTFIQRFMELLVLPEYHRGSIAASPGAGTKCPRAARARPS